MPRLTTSRKSNVRKNQFGYASLSLRGDSLQYLKDEFAHFQDSSLEELHYGNPLLSDFVELLLTIYKTPEDKLPRLILVSKSPTRRMKMRVVAYDTILRIPVVCEQDKRGVWHVYSKDSELKPMYEEFARKYSASDK